MGIVGRAFVALQYVVPQRPLSRIVYAATRWRWGPWKNLMIRVLARIYRIRLDEALRPAPHGYVNFADFFTRELRPGARALAQETDAVLCPSDGRISQAGPIDGDRIFQAKGHDYGVAALLGGDEQLAERFRDGSFLTVYLAPHDYHRVHLPLSGTLRQTVYVPGKLFSVSPTTVAGVPGLFARNERLVTLFDTADAGSVAVVLVGAMLVSSIETVWEGEVARTAEVSTARFDEGAHEFERGDEIGRFNMGSTVIVLFEPDRVDLEALGENDAVRMGQRIARTRPAP